MSFSTKGPRKAADMPRMLIGHVIFVPLCWLFALRRTNNKIMVKYSVALTCREAAEVGKPLFHWIFQQMNIVYVYLGDKHEENLM